MTSGADEEGNNKLQTTALLREKNINNNIPLS